MRQNAADQIQETKQALSEYDSKKLIAEWGVPVTKEILAQTEDEAVKAASDIGYPVVLKGSSSTAIHKTEMDLVRLKLENEEDLRKAFREITGKGADLDGVLVQEMVYGKREFVIGLHRDPTFGPSVMFGAGGIMTELIKDVSFRIAPFDKDEAMEMIEEISMNRLLDEFRGEPPVNREVLARALVGIGELARERDDIAEIDINPLIIKGDRPVAVDALVILNRNE